MKIVTKKVFAMLLALVMVTAMTAGCGKKNQSNNATPTQGATTGTATAAPTQAPANVKMDTIRVWTDNASEKDLRVQQIDNFNNTVGKQDGIKIEYTVYGSNYQDSIKIAAQSGEAPEIFRPNGTFRTDFVNAGYLVPLTDFPGGQELVDQYKDSLITNQQVFNGKVYTLPYNLTTYKFLVNNDLFKAAGITAMPKTWDDVRADAKLITAASKGNAYGFIFSGQSDWFITSYLTKPNGVNFGNWGFDYVTGKFNFEEYTPLFENIVGMIKDGSMFPGFEGLDADAARAQFAEGRVGMIPAASFDAGVYNVQFPAKCDWSVIETPALTADGTPYREFVDATDLLGLGQAATKLPEKSMEVYKFFYSDENAAQMYEQAYYIPFRQEAIDMAKNQPTQKGFADFANVPNKVIDLPIPDTFITPEGDPYRTAMEKLFTSGADVKDVAPTLKDIDARYNKALEALDPNVLKQFMQDQSVVDSWKK